MSIRRMMLFSLGAKIKNLVEAFKSLVQNNQGVFEADTCMESQLTELDSQGLLDSATNIYTANSYADGETFQLRPSITNIPIRNLLWNTGLFNLNTVSANAVTYAHSTASTDPFGGTYSGLVAETTDNSSHNVTSRIFPFTKNNTNYTFSVYLKKGNGATAPNIMQLNMFGNGFQVLSFVNFNISTGTIVRVGTSPGTSATITDAGNGWWRCSITSLSVGANEGSTATIGFTNNTDATTRFLSYIGQTTSNVFAYGMQVEEGASVTAYQDIAHPLLINNAGGVVRFSQLATKLNSDKTVGFAGYNLIRGSSTPEAPLFGVIRATSQANVAQAPDGTMTAYKIVEDTSNGTHYISATVNFSQKLGSVVSASVYLKAAERTRAYVEINDSPRFPAALFNLLNGTLISTTSPLLTASIESVGDGWYKCNVSLTRANVNNIDVLTRAGASLAIMPMVGNDPTYSGNGTSGILVWQPQAVLGTTPKPSLPSTLNFFPRLSYNDFDGYNDLNSCPTLNLESSIPNQFTFSEDFNRGGNLLLHSQDFTQAVWNKGGATIISSARVAPDGTPTGTELSDVGASSTPSVTTQVFTTTSTIVTYSIYTKSVSLPTSGTRTFLLRNNTTVTNFDVLNFNYSSTGNLGNGWFSENVGNGWFRLSYTRTTGISIGDTLIVYYGRGNSAPVGATDVWQVWGAQVEPNERLTDYTLTASAIALGTITSGMTVASRTIASPNPNYLADTLIATTNNALLRKISNGGLSITRRLCSVYLRRKTGSGAVTLNLGNVSKVVNINSSEWRREFVIGEVLSSTYSATSGLYTVITSTPHGLLTGDSIEFRPSTGTATNAIILPIIVTSTTQFTFRTGALTTSGNCLVIPMSARITMSTAGDEIYIWGIQLEGGAVNPVLPLSYAPTYTTALASTPQDIAYFNIPTTTNKTVLMEFKKIGSNTNSTTLPLFFLGDNLGPTFANNYVGVNGGTSITMVKRVNQASTTFANPLSSYGFITNKYNKFAFVFNGTNVDIWIDGVLQTTTSFATPQLVRYLAFLGVVGLVSLKSIYSWNSVLTPAQLSQLTYSPMFPNGTTELTQLVGRAFASSIPVPSNSTLQALDTFITTLKTSGTWDKMDAIYNFAYNNTNVASFSRLNMKSTFYNLGISGTMTYQTSGYLAGVGSSYLTGYRPNVDNIQYQVDAFSRTHILYQAAAGARIDANSINDLNDTFYNSNTNTHRALSNVNLPQSVDMSGTGLKSMVRNNGASVTLYNQSTGTTLAQPRVGFYGTSNQFFPFGNGLGVGFSCFGAPLTQTDINTIRTAYNTYLTTIGLTPFA